ncbi:hypothetical protein [Paraburkholderia sp. BCC1884]|uniref:hypothetical protein n=1 Tax=Paraburkholderia sp. BCC1884 TaxID=2562668 RepID=UPI001182CF9C|nr:hypothetical protein [Paraburkholderia sp. BCC1884]
MKAVISIAVAMLSISSAFATPTVGELGLGANGKAALGINGANGANGGQDGGKDQRREELSVAVVDTSGPVAGAKCILANDKGEWSVSAPDTVMVRRSASALKGRCEKEGYAATESTVEATTIKIEPRHFRFGTDAGGDGGDDESSLVTVPQYSPSIVIALNAKGGPQTTN